MKRIIITAMACILLSFSVIGFAKEYPETITTIYLKDGTIIKCDMGWVDGDILYYRKYGGTIGISLNRIDIGKSFKKSIQQEEKWKTKEAERKARLHTNDRGEDIIYLKDARVFTDGSMRFGDIDVSLNISGPSRGRTGSYVVYKITYTITNHGPDANIQLWIAPFDSHGHIIYARESQKPAKKTKYRYVRKGKDVIKWIKITDRYSQCEFIDKWKVTRISIREPLTFQKK